LGTKTNRIEKVTGSGSKRGREEIDDNENEDNLI
jgi:hypothetical protein